MSKKVILSVSSVEAVGVAVHVLNLAKLLEDANLLQLVICPGSGWLTEQLDANCIEYEVLDSEPKIHRAILSNIETLRYLSKRRNSIVHLHGRFPLFVSILSIILLHESEFYVTVHQFSDSSDSGVFGWKSRLETLFWKYFVDGICCVSAPVESEVVDRIGESRAKKTRVIHNWIEPLHRGKNGQKSEESTTFKIASIGRLSHEKGFDLLVESIRSVVEDGHCVTCDIYGNGARRDSLSQTISEYGIGGEVSLKGAHPDVRQVLPEYDALVIPSRSESFGLVILEAYDAGVPVIASDIPGLSEIVEHSETGLLFRPGDPQALVSAIETLMQSEYLRDQLSDAGQEYVEGFYPNEQILADYKRFYYE